MSRRRHHLHDLRLIHGTLQQGVDHRITVLSYSSSQLFMLLCQLMMVLIYCVTMAITVTMTVFIQSNVLQWQGIMVHINDIHFIHLESEANYMMKSNVRISYVVNIG